MHTSRSSVCSRRRAQRRHFNDNRQKRANDGSLLTLARPWGRLCNNERSETSLRHFQPRRDVSTHSKNDGSWERESTQPSVMSGPVCQPAEGEPSSEAFRRRGRPDASTGGEQRRGGVCPQACEQTCSVLCRNRFLADWAHQSHWIKSARRTFG